MGQPSAPPPPPPRDEAHPVPSRHSTDIPPPQHQQSIGVPVAATTSQEAPPRVSSQQSRPGFSDLQQASTTSGAQLVRAAKGVFDQGKRGYYGDGSPVGFVRVAFDQARLPLGKEWGVAVYEQEAGSRLKSFDEPRAGDVAAFHDAKFKGKKGLQSYHQQVGTDCLTVSNANFADIRLEVSRIHSLESWQSMTRRTSTSSVCCRLSVERLTRCRTALTI